MNETAPLQKTSTDMFEDTSDDMSKAEYKELLPKLQARIRELQYALYERKIPLMLVYEGMDAAGKGGNIKRVRESLDPTGYEVNAISAPTETELSYHYLWRFATDVPKAGISKSSTAAGMDVYSLNVWKASQRIKNGSAHTMRLINLRKH